MAALLCWLWALSTQASGGPELAQQFELSQSDRALFRLAGSNTIGAALGPNLARGFLRQQGFSQVFIEPAGRNNEYRVSGLWQQQRRLFIDIAAHGSSTGFKGLGQASADIAMSSRPIKAAEIKKLARLGDMQQPAAEHVIAIDGIAILVHPSNPIKQLSVADIGRIFSGQLRRWEALGQGHSGPINLYARDNNSGTWDTFKSLVLGKTLSLAGGAQRFESNDRLSDSVAADPGGIGFAGLASVRKAKALRVSAAGATALPPAHMSVATEDYPLARRLHLYTPAKGNSQMVRAFIEFAHSREGQNIVERSGFVSQNPIALDNRQGRQGPEAYLRETARAQRLSLNFRFRPHSAELDNKARQDIRRLAALMAAPEYRQRRILLIGFGDEKQSPRRAEILSKLRAAKVKSALHAAGVSSLPVSGYGAFKPVAGNRGGERIKNRRVEVWLR